MGKKIPGPSIGRLNSLYGLLEKLEKEGRRKVYSAELGKALGAGSHSIRKDINYLGEAGNTNAGYDVGRLKGLIHDGLGFGCVRKVCIAGLGRLGGAVLSYEQFSPAGYEIVAGFDTDINTLEIMKTTIPLYPVYEMGDVIKSQGIELAILTVPGDAARGIADKLIDAGIKGILNFAPVIIKHERDDIFIQNIDFLGELRLLSAFLSLGENKKV